MSLKRQNALLVVEDKEDCIKMCPLLNDSKVTIKRVRYEKDPHKVKRKQKQVVKTISLESIVPELKSFKLYLTGKSGGKTLKVEITPNDSLLMQKKFSTAEISYIKRLKKKSIVYLAVEPGMILCGTITEKQFLENSRKYFSFKQSDYVQEVKQFLKRFDLGVEKHLVCTKILAETLRAQTKLEWNPIKIDALSDWKSRCLFFRKEEELMKSFLRDASLCERHPQTVLECIQQSNFKKLYVTQRCDPVIYSYLTNQNDLSSSDKITILPHSERIEVFVPKGIMLVKYF